MVILTNMLVVDDDLMDILMNDISQEYLQKDASSDIDKNLLSQQRKECDEI